MRPLNLMPLERDVINTQFILRTRDNLQVGRTRKDQGQRRTRQGQRRTRGRVGPGAEKEKGQGRTKSREGPVTE